MRRSLALSGVVHAAILALVVFVTHHRLPLQQHADPSFQTPARMVWLAEPGPGGGGGGGGNRMAAPARRAELPGHDAVTVPVAARRPPIPTPDPRDAIPTEQLAIPAVPRAAGLDALPGAIEAPPGAPTLSQGPGGDSGAGTGRGGGDGPGLGKGLGPGREAGTGGDAYHPGNGVAGPRIVYAAKPRYTSDAMRARLQGSVIVECVVQTNGVCTNIRLKRSLDPVFGLDQEAIKAAEAWRFVPGSRFGQPVAVIVTIQLDFVLR